jgi:hypothetical protein
MTSVFDLPYPDQSSQVSNSDIRDQIKADWLESGVDPHLIDLNALPLGGADLFDFLYPNPKRINSGRLNSYYLELWYKCSEAAGWLCNGRFRQIIGKPIKVDKKGRVQRYFNPEGGKAPITFLRVPLHIWEKVAELSGKSMPEHIELTDDGEALGFWDWVQAREYLLYWQKAIKKLVACSLMGLQLFLSPASTWDTGQSKKTFSAKLPLENFTQPSNLLMMAAKLRSRLTTDPATTSSPQNGKQQMLLAGC